MSVYTVIGPVCDLRGSYNEPAEGGLPWLEVEAETAAKAKAQVIRTNDFVDVCFGGAPGESPFKWIAAFKKPPQYDEEMERFAEALPDEEPTPEEEQRLADQFLSPEVQRYELGINAAIERLTARYRGSS